MTRFRRLSLVAAALAASGVVLGEASGAAAATLTLRTVPALSGVDFSFDGKRYSTPANGVLKIQTTSGTHALRSLPWRHPERGIRVAFSRWLDDTFKPARTVTLAGNTKLEVGYGISYRVNTSFEDLARRKIPSRRVSSVTLASSLGEKYKLRGGRPRWLVGVRVARRLNGLEPTLVRYSVMQTDVEGANVVHQAQQRFYIARTRNLRIRLSLYDAHFSTHDLVLGTPVGRAIRLTYPNGREVDVALRDGEATLRSLPRGQYQVKVLTGMGIAPAIPVALSRNQDVSLKVISYFDLLGGFLLFALLSFGLVAAKRPHLRPRALARSLFRRRNLKAVG